MMNACTPHSSFETCLTLSDEQLTARIRAAINGELDSNMSFAELQLLDHSEGQSFSPLICLGPTYVALRHKGRLRQTQWHYESNLNHLLNRMIEGAIALVSQKAEGIDAIELCFTHTYCSVQLSEFKSTFANIYRGLRGVELQYQDQLERYSPTRMIASNLSFHKILEQFLSRHHLSPQAFVDNGGIIQAFQTRQVFVTLTPDVQALTLHRGNRVVPLEKLSGETLDDLTVQMGQWLLRQIDSDGRMVYKYFPSRGQESNANNLIRQFMATLALIRYAKSTQQSTHWAIAKQNLDYNLTQFYTSDEDLGWVEYEGKAKLGAIALAALAILELSEDPTAHSTPGLTIVPSHQDVFDKLCATIDTLWQSDGSFRTFYKPSDRNDNQNFYPGEALLFWAVLYHRTHDPQLLKRCRISFSYYRDWHRAHYNPAFIPWHTQAYALLYDATGDRSFLEFIFEMNDNLLSMQQWNPESENCHEDVQGRFYDAGADYGPPHASSTGVYLEGLADAYRLAVQAQESARAAAYRTVIWRGLRSVRQLQFRDAVDMFYISKRSVVQGAIRTTVYDNVIRVDNVQHCLMALLRLKQLPAFQPEATPPSVDDQTPSALLAIAPHSSDSAAELTHFRVMHQTVDIQPLIKELAANSQLWHHDTSRQDNINVQRETNSIYLRSAVKPFPPGITNSNDVHASHRTRVSDHFPQILNWVEQFATAQDGELGRVTIVRLAPRGRVYRHIDHGEYYRLRDRYHLVLHSSAGSLLGAGDEWICMQPGECWWFNNKAPHEAYNPSDDWRIHLIFDVQHKGRSELDRPSV